MNQYVGVLLIAWGLVGVISLALWLDNGRRDLDRINLTELTDNTVHFDPIVDHGHTSNWPTTDMPAESTAGLTEHEAPALDLFRLALLQPDSELLPAEEA